MIKSFDEHHKAVDSDPRPMRSDEHRCFVHAVVCELDLLHQLIEKATHDQQPTKDGTGLYWRERYEILLREVQRISDEGNFQRDQQPAEPISMSDEFFISNDLQVCDSEEHAKTTWGEGNYFRVIRAP